MEDFATKWSSSWTQWLIFRSKVPTFQTESFCGGLGPRWPYIFKGCEHLVLHEVCAIFENVGPTDPKTPTERLGLTS